MTRRSLGLASFLVVAAMLLVSVAIGLGLPADIRLPIHWNLAGEADGFGAKWLALLVPAAVTSAVSLLFFFLPALEPRKTGLERSQGLYLWGWLAILLMCATIHFLVVAAALGWAVRVVHVLVAAGGVMLVLIGNQLGKSRSMYLIGVRTPWTLASEEVWIKTHRLGGKLMVGGGVIMLAAASLPIPSGLLGTLVAVIVAVAAGVPVVYSFVLWRREKAAQSSG